ncbi:MAG: asparagine synthase (glutamine-hydrolyzing) [Elusimicrobiales bacterium]|nr:asparagine synthase (glutamine-hydrolyzing) [Elusimicrobiales bacterium]
MCGILGLVNNSGKVDPSLLCRMRDALRHRGPDSTGHWISENGRVGFGHRRLAILDLSPKGYQPMTAVSGRAVIVLNGEIYNFEELREELRGKGYSFDSSSDTEVVLNAYLEWGEGCLKRINGMFSFCIYDIPGRKLFLARDRAGEKPLFYSCAGGNFAFASELKALMADPGFSRKVNLDSLNFYLSYGYVPGERCILQGVFKLLPGHALRYDLSTSTMTVQRYWAPPEISGYNSSGLPELTKELTSLLSDSVRRQLVADVPVGIMLSGGVDSSIITAIAARVSVKPVRTFTVSFPGHGKFNEAEHAKLVARHCGAVHSDLVAEPVSPEILEDIVAQFDEPIADNSIIPTFLLSRLMRQHTTVAIGGDGGDELFGGYPYYSYLQLISQLHRLLPSQIRRKVLMPIAERLPLGVKGRNYAIAAASADFCGISQVNLLFNKAWRRKLMAPFGEVPIHSLGAPEEYKIMLGDGEIGTLRKALKTDFLSYLVDNILVKTDRAAMLASLEMRAPFLDYRVIEFAFSKVPDKFKATLFRRKIILRHLAKELLPKDLDVSRKQGFSVPLARWIRGDFGNYLRDVVSGTGVGAFDKEAVSLLLRRQFCGDSNPQRLFALAIFQLWSRRYKVEI